MNVHAVYLNAFLGSDKDIPRPVNDTRFHQVAPLGIDVDRHIRGTDLKFWVNDIAGAESGV